MAVGQIKIIINKFYKWHQNKWVLWIKVRFNLISGILTIAKYLKSRETQKIINTTNLSVQESVDCQPRPSPPATNDLSLQLAISHAGISSAGCHCCYCLETNNIDGLVQNCSNSIANALELLQSCTKPSIHGSGHRTAAFLLPGFAINW